MELGADAGRVHLADMGELGTNPAWIIPAWRDFVTRVGADGGRLRGIGEPIFPERSPEELVECHRHEALLNLAFANTRGFWLLCPYDTDVLPPAVIEHALRNHPVYAEDGVSRQSDFYSGLEAVTRPFTEPLPEPPQNADKVLFHGGSLKLLREWVFDRAGQAGMTPAGAADLVLAANELATNSVCHAGGHGALRVWEEGDSVVCEVRDNGCIDEPLVGREPPATDRAGQAGMTPAGAADLVLAANELATNSVCHAGGHGALRVWEEGDSVVCEVRDNGCIDEPLVGRERPATNRAGSSGLWMVNQLCQLVQIRSSPSGSIVRMRIRRS
jgi:anti-sigma regulatory factor (Ser/Thr protein kinase)